MIASPCPTAPTGAVTVYKAPIVPGGRKEGREEGRKDIKEGH